MKIHHGDTEARRKETKRTHPCLRASVAGVIDWELTNEPQPNWRYRDVGGACEQLDERLTRDRAMYWRFFYSRDPKRRDITGKLGRDVACHVCVDQKPTQ